MTEPDVLARVATPGIEPLAESSGEFPAFSERDPARSQELQCITNFQAE